MRRLISSVILFLCIIQPTFSQEVGQAVLEERTVQLEIHGADTSAQCLGFRLHDSDLPDSVELIVTAGHCVQFAIEQGDATTRSGLIKAPNGAIAQFRYAVYYASEDVGFILATPNLGYLTPMGRYLQDPPKNLPIMSMISVGGGKPTLAIGFVLTVDGDGIHVIMPGGPGSSGGPVVDENGRFLGIISRGLGYHQSAGYYVTLVSAGVIARVLARNKQTLIDKAATY